MSRPRHPALTIALIPAFAALMALSAQASVPMHPVPMTMQSAAILLAGAVLGLRGGVAAVLLYLAAASMGLPVLSDGTGGLSRFAGPTAGYLFGFPIAAGATGWAAGRGLLDRPLTGVGLLMAAHLLLLGLGAAGLARTMGVQAALEAGFTPFLIGAAIKSALVMALRWGWIRHWPGLPSTPDVRA